MGTAEAKIEKYLVKEVKRLGGFTRKYISPGVRGVPDRIVFFPGQVVFVEVKTEIGVLSKLQQLEIARLHKYRIPVVVLKSKKEVDKCLEALTALQKRED